MTKKKESFDQKLQNQLTSQRQVWYLPKHIILEEFQSRKYILLTTITICFTVIALLLWSMFATIDEKSITTGELIPVGRVKIIQHLEGGIVKDVLVENNTIVQQGQPIIQLTSTQYRSELQQLITRQESLKNDAERLQAFIDNKNKLVQNLNGRSQTAAELMLLEDENQILSIQNKARQDQISVIDAQTNAQLEEIERLRNEITIKTDNLALLNQEVSMYEELIADGYVSKKEYLQALRARNTGNSDLYSLKQQLKQSEQKLIESKQSKESLVSKLQEDASKQLDEIRESLAEVIHNIERLKDKVARTTIRAPISGVVKGLEVTTGQVIPPGGEVFTVVPNNEMLQAEVKIDPKDIGHVSLGDEAVVKVAAYDYARYGSLKGELIAISATSFKDRQGNPYYKGIISLNLQYANNPENKLKAGMTLVADIVTGEKTVLQYLLKPIHTTLEASFYER